MSFAMGVKPVPAATMMSLSIEASLVGENIPVWLLMSILDPRIEKQNIFWNYEQERQKVNQAWANPEKLFGNIKIPTITCEI